MVIIDEIAPGAAPHPYGMPERLVDNEDVTAEKITRHEAVGSEFRARLTWWRRPSVRLGYSQTNAGLRHGMAAPRQSS